MKKVILLIVLLCIITSPASATWTINNRNVSNPILLRKLLDDRIGTLDDEVTVLQNNAGFGSVGTGSIFYVDSAASNGAATTWATAKTTLDAAIALCTANNGDLIYVAQGHAENLAAANAVDIDVAGVTVIGLGNGADMPEFTYTNANGEFVIGAANVTVINCRFLAGITSITMGISIEAAGDNFSLIDCIFPKPTTNSWEFLDSIDVADGANDILIYGCEAYNDEAGAAPAHFIEAGNGTAGPVRLQVVNCIIKGDFSVSAIWSDEPCDEAFIYGNTITQHTAGQHCIEFTDTGTGAIAHNNLYSSAKATTLDPGSMTCFENYVSTAVDTSGVLYPNVAETIAGQTYVSSMTSLAIDDDLFAVAGGDILITSFTGKVTTVMQAQANALEIVLDATDTYDYDFTTAVETNADAAGTRYVFDDTETESVLTPCEGADGGAAGTMVHWLCTPGMIELNAAQAAQTGGVKWYMTWIPLDDGTTVTAQ